LGAEFVSDLIQEVVKMCGIQDRFQEPFGTLLIRSTIPIGAGLGSSAALCVAIVSWLAQPFGIHQEDLMRFATQLEHRFHGKSSGMDVAVIAADEPITFTMQGGLQRLGVQKLPRFTLHDTGLRSRTSDCIVQVDDFRKKHQTAAVVLDEQMAQASRLAQKGLMEFSAGHEVDGLSFIVHAMQSAQRCFAEWGLLPEPVRLLEQQLLQKGARAVKLTGAGGGGMVVALWDA
jgi:mevalonate kinase